eukprot:TRINITY_DN11250_c0_g1_i1.p1 TRINITY_DN11250_c0_g1~~TRINITY_DN11250_c0_g1_i1.p1  ORF type:complete len:731 (-),score=251.12 TRINITY_DN11250_c0_g1_i1:8-2200(-)
MEGQYVYASSPSKNAKAKGFQTGEGKIIILKDSVVCHPDKWADAIREKKVLEKDFYRLNFYLDEEKKVCILLSDSHPMAPSSAMGIVCGFKSGNKHWNVLQNQQLNYVDSPATQFYNQNVNSFQGPVYSSPYQSPNTSSPYHMQQNEEELNVKRSIQFDEKIQKNSKESSSGQLNPTAKTFEPSATLTLSNAMKEREMRINLLNLESDMSTIEEMLISRVKNGLELIVLVDGDQCLSDLTVFADSIEHWNHEENFSKKVQIVAFMNDQDQIKNLWKLNRNKTMMGCLFQFQTSNFKNGVDFQISVLLGRLDAKLEDFERNLKREERVAVCLLTNDKFARFILPRFEKRRRCSCISGSLSFSNYLYKSLERHTWAKPLDRTSLLLEEKMEKLVLSNEENKSKLMDGVTITDIRKLKTERKMRNILRRKISPGEDVSLSHISSLLPQNLRKFEDLITSTEFLKSIHCIINEENAIQSEESLPSDCTLCKEIEWRHGKKRVCCGIYTEKLINYLIFERDSPRISLAELGQEVPISKEIKRLGGWKLILKSNGCKNMGITLTEDSNIFLTLKLEQLKPRLNQSFEAAEMIRIIFAANQEGPKKLLSRYIQTVDKEEAVDIVLAYFDKNGWDDEFFENQAKFVHTNFFSKKLDVSFLNHIQKKMGGFDDFAVYLFAELLNQYNSSEVKDFMLGIKWSEKSIKNFLLTKEDLDDEEKEKQIDSFVKEAKKKFSLKI